MSYQEKRTIMNLVTGTLLLVSYCIYAFVKYMPGMADPNDLASWAGLMLVFIGIGIAAMIAAQILFHIIFAASIAVRDRKCDEKEINRTIEASIIEDEMDKLIELKTLRLGFVFAGTGFILGLVSLVLGSSAAVMLNMIFLSCFVGSIAEGILSLHYYRRGVKNG
jgi:hypothetical protein